MEDSLCGALYWQDAGPYWPPVYPTVASCVISRSHHLVRGCVPVVLLPVATDNLSASAVAGSWLLLVAIVVLV